MNNNVVVVDIGTETTKCGLNFDPLPKYLIPTVAGFDKFEYEEYASVAKKKRPKLKFFGDNALHADCHLRYPVEYGFPTSMYSDLEEFLSYVLNEKLKVKPCELSAMLTIRSRTPKLSKEKITEAMFESFEMKGLYLPYAEAMTLVSTGSTTGYVVECGEGFSLGIPVYDGYVIPSKDWNLQLTGRDLSHYLLNTLSKLNKNASVMQHIRNKNLLHQLKNLCYVSTSFKEESESLKKSSSTFTLPDGNNIFLGDTLCSCPEICFNPKVNSCEISGFDEAIITSINKCDKDIQNLLFSNIVLGGGSTQFHGFQERLEKEVLSKTPGRTKVKVNGTQGKISAWLGACAIASTKSFFDCEIKKEEYDEYGPCIVHKKCF